MKKTLLIAALTLASASAFASKARVNALGNSPHLVDVQNIFSKPNQALSVGELATFEFGSTAGAATNAEGGFLRKAGDATWGAYLGRTSATVAATRTGQLAQENPFNLVYAAKAGDMDWGVNFYYTKSDKKSTKQKQDAMSVAAGFASGMWDARVILGLGNNATTDNAGTETKLTGKTSFQIGGGYWMDSMYLFADMTQGGAKSETGTAVTNDMTSSTTQVGIENTHKKDGTDFFYGAALKMESSKDDKTSVSTDDEKKDTTSMPVWVGIEAEAASWLVFRGSLTQNFGLLVGSTKTTTGGTGEADTLADSTKVAAGVGMKWGKFMVDGFVANSGTNGGAFGLDGNFLTQTSLTYTF